GRPGLRGQPGASVSSPQFAGGRAGPWPKPHGPQVRQGAAEPRRRGTIEVTRGPTGPETPSVPPSGAEVRCLVKARRLGLCERGGLSCAAALAASGGRLTRFLVHADDPRDRAALTRPRLLE